MKGESPNFYNYVVNSPLLLKDPTGREPKNGRFSRVAKFATRLGKKIPVLGIGISVASYYLSTPSDKRTAGGKYICIDLGINMLKLYTSWKWYMVAQASHF